VATLAGTALPFFALIGLGWAVVRTRVLPAATVPGLNGFVFYVTLPALLFDEVSSAPSAELADPRFLLAYYVPTLGLLLGVAAISRRVLGTERPFAIVQGMGACWSNAGYMGIPLLLTFAGPKGALPAVLVLVFDNLLTSPISIAILESARGEASRLAATVARTFASLARHPLILATVAGVVGGLVPFGPPAPVARVIELLAGATVPCALFALGGSLVGVPLSEARREVALLVALKLVAHPLLVAAMVYVVVPLEPTVAMASVIVAALPTGAMVFVLAERYDSYVRRASTVVLVSHVASVATVSALLVAYGG
jgi:predicted permease